MSQNAPSKAFQSRLTAAKRWRKEMEPLIKEVFTFCAPGREYDFNTTRKKNDWQPTTYHSLGEEVATDLAGDLITYYTPAEAPWASYLVTQDIPAEIAQEVMAMVQAREQDFQDLILASNYNDVAPMWGFETATHGTPALWVTQASVNQPIHVEIVPPDELLITPGHLGKLDRFREMRVPYETLPALFKGVDDVTLTPMIVQKTKKPGIECNVIWGFWVDWEDAGRPVWKMEITVDGERVTPKEPVDLGDLAGNCPLLVGRFGPRPGRPWGRGPGLKALPNLRTLDKIEESVLLGLDDALLRTLIYPDDGFLDLSEGLEAGRTYPAHRGFTREQIYEFPRGTNLDYGFFSEERLEAAIRTSFYQDGPRQRGETPPTASQWLDERRRVQQRLGKPSAPLWSELILPLIQRFETLAVESGKMSEAITVQEEAIAVVPISPLQKAQDNDKVMVARSNLGLAMETLGENSMAVVDPIATFSNIVRVSGDTLTVIRKQEQAPPGAEAPGAPA